MSDPMLTFAILAAFTSEELFKIAQKKKSMEENEQTEQDQWIEQNKEKILSVQNQLNEARNKKNNLLLEPKNGYTTNQEYIEIGKKLDELYFVIDRLDKNLLCLQKKKYYDYYLSIGEDYR